MEWLVGSCYAGSLLLYLSLKVYFENEYKKSIVMDDPDCRCFDCSRGMILFNLSCDLFADHSHV